jgi:hypothetical protein
MNALVELYTRVGAEHVSPAKELRKYAKLGFINAFFLADWMSATVEGREKIITDWVRVVLHIRKTGNKSIVEVRGGAQNLNDNKLRVVLANVHAWLNTGVLPEHLSDAGTEDSEEEA